MKKTIIILMFILLAFTATATNQYFEIDLHYTPDELSANKVNVIPSAETLQTPMGKYVAETVSFDNKILNVTFFNIPTFFLWDGFDPETGEITDGGIRYLNESDVTLYIPYYENAQEINIYDYNLTKLLTISVSSYAKNTETIELPQEKDEQEEKVLEISEEKKKNTLVLVIAGIIVLLIIFSIIMIRKKQIE